MKFYTYDLETLINFFSFTGKVDGDPTLYQFEISPRRNLRDQLLTHLAHIQQAGYIMVGYNNLGFDYPILHSLLTEPYLFDYTRAYVLCQNIINGQNDYGRGNHMIGLRDRLIPQLDLVKVNHFHNKTKRTRLKDLQFAMRSQTLEDLPVEIGVPLTDEQMDIVLKYNAHDVTETEKFLQICKPAIAMRQELLEQGVLQGDVLNYDDVKLGTEYLIKKIGRQKCFIKGSVPNQTPRTAIKFSQIILPKIHYRTEHFGEVLRWFNEQTYWVNGDSRPSLEITLANIPFKFGIGGVHASVEDKAYESSETHIIRDVDVSGMYVAVAIANKFYPEHLGQSFIDAYAQLKSDRAKYKKGTTLNKILKLAGNGVYGNSNNEYSCFFDPKYTFTVTVNGQLQLLQLVELLSLIPGLELIQANTDGVTAYLPRSSEWMFDIWCKEWEALTNLELEHVRYKKMFIRDVNNYLAVKENGEVKAKGAYWYPKTFEDYEGNWHKDMSNMVVQKAIEQVLVNNYRPEDVVKLFTNPFDFMLRYKTTAGSRVFIGDKEVSKTVRYYVSTRGEKMTKRSKPKGKIGDFKRKNGISDELYNRVLKDIPEGTWDERIHTKNKSRYTENVTSIKSGWLVKDCNDASRFDWSDVDYDYYIQEVRKLMVSSGT